VAPVLLFVGALLLALLLVPLTKGSFHRLGRLHFRWLWVLLVALIVQFVLELVEFPKDRIGDVGLALLLCTYAMILVFCYLNRQVKGMALVTVGIVLNVLVIAVNAGMPTKDDVFVRNGHELHVPIERTVKHRPEEQSDRLGFLGDKISLPGETNTDYSIGDVIICLGIIDVCWEASRVPRRRGVRVPARPTA
jgi:hypothetical protein